MKSEISNLKFLVIGYGNPLRGDDGIGWEAIERLESLGLPADVELLAHHQLMPELAEKLAHSYGTILIDAAVDLSPGQIRRQEIRGDEGLPELMHDLSASQLAGMVRGLYGQCGPVVLFTVGGQCWDLVEGLSPAVAGALDSLLKQVSAHLESWRADHA